MAKAFKGRSQHVVGDILATAAVLFDEQGYGQVSLQDIADRVGIARPSLYHYFPSKAAMLAALVERATETRETIIDAVVKMDGGPLTRLQMLLRRMASFSLRIDRRRAWNRRSNSSARIYRSSNGAHRALTRARRPDRKPAWVGQEGSQRQRRS